MHAGWSCGAACDDPCLTWGLQQSHGNFAACVFCGFALPSCCMGMWVCMFALLSCALHSTWGAMHAVVMVVLLSTVSTPGRVLHEYDEDGSDGN